MPGRAPRRQPPLVDQLAALVARPGACGRIAIVLADNLRSRIPAGSLVLRAFLAAHADAITLVYTPAYDSDANRIEWLWRPTRPAVTDADQRTRIDNLTADLTGHFADLAAHPDDVLCHVGSPTSTPRPPTSPWRSPPDARTLWKHLAGGHE